MKQSELPKGMNGILMYAAREEQVFNAFAAECGYERKTTFFSDLSIAECCGVAGIKDTYNRVVNTWLANVEYFTEFVMSLNWKSFEWYGREGEESEIGQLYAELYEKADQLACDKYQGEDASYYYRTTD